MTWVNHAQSLIAYNQWANAKTRAPALLAGKGLTNIVKSVPQPDGK